MFAGFQRVQLALNFFTNAVVFLGVFPDFWWVKKCNVSGCTGYCKESCVLLTRYWQKPQVSRVWLAGTWRMRL